MNNEKEKRKVIAAINMTIDGICDHTVGIPDEDLHKHYSDLIDQGGLFCMDV